MCFAVCMCLCVSWGPCEKNKTVSTLEELFIAKFEVKSSSLGSSFTEKPMHGPNSAKG